MGLSATVSRLALGLLALSTAAVGEAAAKDSNILNWDSLLHPGIKMSELETHLRRIGVAAYRDPDGLTYSSRIITDKRDYLFCNDKLYGIVEGELVDSRQFVKWMLTYLNTREALGKPASTEIDPITGILTTWKLENGSELLFHLAAGEPDRIKWSRELYHIPTGKECGVTERSTRAN